MAQFTPSQTVGPFFSMALAHPGENVLVPPDTEGRIRLEGTVYDGDGKHVEDALVEIWQADPKGRYRHPDDSIKTFVPHEVGEGPCRAERQRSSGGRGDGGFTGFGRVSTDFETGRYWFDTLKPGPVPDPEGELQAPHISVVVQGRGMLNPLFTRVYFADEAEANQRDLVLGMVPAERRHTLVACVAEGADLPCYRFDIRLQGEDETVFFHF